MAFSMFVLLVITVAVMSVVTAAAFDRDEGILLGGVSVERMTNKHARGNLLGFLNNQDHS